MSLVRKISSFFVVLAIVAAAALIGLWQGERYLLSWAQESRPLAQAVELSFPPGSSVRSLAKSLEEKGLIESQYVFLAWVRFYSEANRFQAGRYRFEKSVSPEQIAKTIIKGKVYRPVLLEFTIPEGFTVEKVKARLLKLGLGNEQRLSELLADTSLLEPYLEKVPPSLEGFLYPATYKFYEEPNAEKAVRRMIETFFAKLPADYQEKAKEKGIDLYDAVRFASLIELETSHDDERSLISEVIWKRLKRGIPLGIDAAIIYGIENYDGDIRFRHLRDKKNLYNLRLHKGLPPTPICSPSLQSLLAVLSPSDYGYLYYVLNVETESRHHFSKTLKEHNRWVRKLVKGR